MTTEILVANVEQVPFGEGRMFSLGGEDKIAVFRTREGNVHATQPFCPHLGGPLADGLMSAMAVVCPLHDRTFDLASGCGLTHEHMDITGFRAPACSAPTVADAMSASRTGASSACVAAASTR